jgi:hypothetical protein
MPLCSKTKTSIHSKMKTHSNGTGAEQITGCDLAGARVSKLRIRMPGLSRSHVLAWLIATSLLLVWTLAGVAGETASRVTVMRDRVAGLVIKAQLGRDGTIHLLFNQEDGPSYACSKDGGLTFSASIPVVDAAARKPGLKFEGADLAIGRDGHVFVAMSNNAWKLKLPQEEWGLYYATLVPGAKAFSPVRNLNRKPSEGFSLAADGRGAVTATFLSGKLFTMDSRDNGETFTASAELNPAWNPCDCCTTSAAYGADGKLALLYREETNNERDLYVVLWDKTRGGQPSRTRISSTLWKIEGCPMTYFTIAPASNGYVAAWPTKGQVYFSRLDNDGAVLPPGEIKTSGTTGMRTGLLALSAPDGATLIAWKKEDLLGWQLYDAKGQPQGAPGSATSSGSGAAGVVFPNGKFLLFP